MMHVVNVLKWIGGIFFFLATWLAPTVFAVLIVDLFRYPDSYFGVSTIELLEAMVSLINPCLILLLIIRVACATSPVLSKSSSMKWVWKHD